MEALTIHSILPLARGVTALDRWEGMRQMTAPGKGLGWVWWVLMLAVLAAAVVALIVINRKQSGARKRWSEFQDGGSQRGLREIEAKLLRHMVRLSGLKDPNMIYAVESALELGVTRLMQSDKIAAMSDEMRADLMAMLGSIREKLGWGLASTVKELEVFNSSRQIAPGSEVLITGREHLEPIQAVVVDTDIEKFSVQPQEEISGRPGDVWVIRHCCGQVAWEFDGSVVRNNENRVAIRHSEEVRAINRRSFHRVPTNRPAWVARFPFHAEDPDCRIPEFEPATLVEIAGPGLLLRSKLNTETNQRLLVTVRLDEERLVQGVAVAQRMRTDEEGSSLLAVQLVGLDSNELAELVRETNVTNTRQEGRRGTQKPSLSPVHS